MYSVFIISPSIEYILAAKLSHEIFVTTQFDCPALLWNLIQKNRLEIWLSIGSSTKKSTPVLVTLL